MTVSSAAERLLPRLVLVTQQLGEFLVTAGTLISAPATLVGVVAWLQGAFRPATAFPLAASLDDGPVTDTSDAITLTLNTDFAAESYRLTARAEGITLVGGDAAGVFYGCQALLQLLPPTIFRQARAAGARWAVPAVQITDGPRFSWRGTMLDVARHFMSKHDVLRFVDIMAMHRLNVLHLHLTDDQGWRVEITRYPLLTSVGGWRLESQVGAGPDA